MSEIIKFEPNIPVPCSLKYPDGMNVQTRFGPCVKFTMEDGRVLFANEHVAQSIRMAGYKPGQSFTITKRVGNGRTRWDVNPATTKPEELGPKLAQSIQQIRKQVQSAPAPQPVEARGTGTYGPAPRPQTATPSRVPMNVAFGEITRLVSSELERLGEQWDDKARQAAVSTIFIEAGRQGLLGMWERGK